MVDRFLVLTHRLQRHTLLSLALFSLKFLTRAAGRSLEMET